MPGAGDPVADRLRAGGRALLLLADPVSISILHRLALGPLESPELLARIEPVSRSTYFDRLRDLEELSLITRRRRADVPPVAECRLAVPGERLLLVARLLEAWLGGAPQGPLKLGEAYAIVATKALAVGWGSSLLRWLAERPRSLTELEQLVDDFGYRKLERATRDLVQTGLAERAVVKGRLNPYSVTPWARQAASPLAAAIRWERNEIPGRSAPVTFMEAEGGLLLALPLVSLDEDISGTCALLVDADAPKSEGLCGALVRVANGRPVLWGSAAELEHEPDCWVRGTASAWLGAMGDISSADLGMGGNALLAEQMIAALRQVGPVRANVSTRHSSEPMGL